MSKREPDEAPGTGWEGKLRGERLRPSPRLERRLQRWINVTATKRSGTTGWSSARWGGAVALGMALLVGTVLVRWPEPGIDRVPQGGEGGSRVVQPLAEEWFGLEDLLAGMDLVVFAHEEEFIFYDWMVY